VALRPPARWTRQQATGSATRRPSLLHLAVRCCQVHRCQSPAAGGGRRTRLVAGAGSEELVASLLVDQPKMLPAGFGSKMLLAGFQSRLLTRNSDFMPLVRTRDQAA